MPGVLDIIIVVQGVQQLAHLDELIGVGQRGGGGRHLRHVGGDELVALLFQRFADGGEVLGAGGDLGGVLACIEVIGTGVQRIHHQLIGILVLEIDDDDALLGEHEADAAHLAQVAAELVKVMAHIGRGAVAVVGQGLDHDGDAAGAVTLIGDCLILGLVAALGALDNALDVIVGHAVGLGLGNQSRQLGVGSGIAAALLNGHGDLAADLSENLGAGAVGLFLFTLDVIPFAMSGHGKIPLICIHTGSGIAADNYQ